MNRLTKWFIALTISVLGMSICAQEQSPDSPVGQKLQLLLEAFESDDPRSFIENNFSETFLSQFSMDDHTSFFAQVKQMHGGFTVKGIEGNDKYYLVALVRSKKRDAWRRIEIEVSQTAPYKIEGLGLDMAQPPDNVPYTGPKHELVSETQPDDSSVKSGAITEKIDKHLTRMEERGFSGAILIAQDGEIILAKGYGYANRNEKIPFHTSNAFDIGSITKQFTGAAILKLQMMGKLSTADLISKYFENVPDDKSGITIHHLLTHSAGFEGALGFDYDPVSKDEFIRLAFESELHSVPGERYEYSNVGYSLLAAIIEQVSETSYEQFLQDHLFKPAGMKHTGYLLPNWDKDQVVHGYRGEEHFGQPNAQIWAEDGPWWHLRGNGGIISTIHDMYKWHKALEDETVLSNKAKESYYTPHIIEEPGGDTFYGYGWVIAASTRGTKVYMHNGGNPYFANDCYRYVEDDVFVYITSNNGELSAIEQSRTVLRWIFK